MQMQEHANLNSNEHWDWTLKSTLNWNLIQIQLSEHLNFRFELNKSIQMLRNAHLNIFESLCAWVAPSQCNADSACMVHSWSHRGGRLYSSGPCQCMGNSWTSEHRVSSAIKPVDARKKDTPSAAAAAAPSPTPQPRTRCSEPSTPLRFRGVFCQCVLGVDMGVEPV